MKYLNKNGRMTAEHFHVRYGYALGLFCLALRYQPRHDKTNKVSVRPASAQSDQSLRCALSG